SKVYLYEVPFGTNNQPVTIDSADLTGNQGKVELDGEGKEQGLYQLEFNNGHVILLTNDGDMNVEIDLAKRDDYYTISGSEGSQEMRNFILTYTDHTIHVNNAFAEMDSLKQFNASDSLVLMATETKNNRVKEMNDFLKKTIAETKYPGIALLALGWASRSFSKQEFETSLQQTVSRFPQHRALAEAKSNYDARQSQLAEMEKKKRAESSWVGKTAPELELPDVNGKPVRLSSFKGKYVLVDFWASWCGPCRLENPSVVEAYNRFKDKNFTILGVSLDRDKDDWLKAIKDDNLTWTHVSDLQYWNSKAVELYRFDGIPYNVLIDPQGKVVAEGLRGEQLQNKLSQLLP
ncbi:MAG TPA: TlpA disulfide reductase family protein, partial [Chitinophagaceae bacterium]|nr:TlpA disulfide reductase family protein [Chitinophagaceae bacterium]